MLVYALSQYNVLSQHNMPSQSPTNGFVGTGTLEQTHVHGCAKEYQLA